MARQRVRALRGLALACVVLAPAGLAQRRARPGELVLPEGRTLVLDRNARIAPGEYERRALGRDGEQGVIVLKGVSGATIDLRDVTLRGAPADADLDAAFGYGILLVGCDDVTLIGGELGGYRGCIVAENCHRLTIEGFEFDRYHAQRLTSTIAVEGLSDWLQPHENDQGQWLADYGAAICLRDCSEVVVRDCRARHGQNGVLLERSGSCRIYDNDFSFLSGWGLAMYRSSQNVVGRNRFDYCVRGFSPGRYWRGQDSAGILMFERCSENVVAYNSVTHGGDGIFIYAGQDRVRGRAVERGEAPSEGSDRNVLYRNDVSFAVANGIEATFSSGNWVVENVARGCHQHGLWGGYSANTVIVGNQFVDTLGGGISIEHGQAALIAKNVLHGNQIGLELWWDEDPEFVEGPFGQSFDTDSRDHWIISNSFAQNDSDIAVAGSSGVVFVENVHEAEGRGPHLEKVTLAGREEEGAKREQVLDALRGVGGWLPSGRISRSSVQRGEMEQHPLLKQALYMVPPRIPGEQVAFDPEGDRRRGLDTIVMGEWGPWDFENGDARPAPRMPGGVLEGVAWDATWFSWSDGPDPRGSGDTLASWRELESEPLARGRVTTWLSPWGEGTALKSLVGTQEFGLIARAEVPLKAGLYRLTVVSDDGVRLLLDGEVVLENWSWHTTTRDETDVQISGGTHEFVLEYFQIDGAAALTLDLTPTAAQ